MMNRTNDLFSVVIDQQEATKTKLRKLKKKVD